MHWEVGRRGEAVHCLQDIFENLNEGSVLTVMTILIGRVDFVVCGILC